MGVMKMNKASGFTLVELVSVIVILGILAAVAIPKYIDLSGQANQAAVNGVAGALSAGNSINYVSRKASSTNGVAIVSCSAVANTLQSTLSTVYSITGSTSIAADNTVTCTVTGPSPATTSATFSATGI